MRRKKTRPYTHTFRCCFFAVVQKLKHCVYISLISYGFPLVCLLFYLVFHFGWNGMIEPLGFIFLLALIKVNISRATEIKREREGQRKGAHSGGSNIFSKFMRAISMRCDVMHSLFNVVVVAAATVAAFCTCVRD